MSRGTKACQECGNTMRDTFRGTPTGPYCGQCNRKHNNARRLSEAYYRRVRAMVEARVGKVSPGAWSAPVEYYGGKVGRRRSVIMMRVGVEAAERRGHRLSRVRADTQQCSWITYCNDCGMFVVVDPAESDSAYGAAVQQDCPGRVVHPEAKRRNPFEQAVSTTPLTLEPIARDVSDLAMLVKPGPKRRAASR